MRRGLVLLLTLPIIAAAACSTTKTRVLPLRLAAAALQRQVDAENPNPFNHLSQVVDSYDNGGSVPEGRHVPCGGSFRGTGLFVHIHVVDLNTVMQIVHGFRLPNQPRTGWEDFPTTTPRSSVSYKQWFVAAGTWDFVFGPSDSALQHCFIDWTGP